MNVENALYLLTYIIFGIMAVLQAYSGLRDYSQMKHMTATGNEDSAMHYYQMARANLSLCFFFVIVLLLAIGFRVFSHLF